jgi:hypothetical protein
MFLCDVLLRVVMMTPGLFQPAKCVGGVLAKAQEIAVKLIPKEDTLLLAKVVGKFQRQRTMTGTGHVFPKLLLVRRENANAAPAARDGHIPLLGIP